MKLDAIIGGVSITLAGFITNAPPVRSSSKHQPCGLQERAYSPQSLLSEEC